MNNDLPQAILFDLDDTILALRKRRSDLAKNMQGGCATS